MNWKESFSEWKEITLITCSLNWEPHGIICISLWFIEDKIVIADCQMKKSITNLLSNPKIVLISDYIRIEWSVKVYNSWKYLDYCILKNAWTWFHPKNAIIIHIKKVFDLDKGVVIINDLWEK